MPIDAFKHIEDAIQEEGWVYDVKAIKKAWKNIDKHFSDQVINVAETEKSDKMKVFMDDFKNDLEKSQTAIVDAIVNANQDSFNRWENKQPHNDLKNRITNWLPSVIKYIPGYSKEEWEEATQTNTVKQTVVSWLRIIGRAWAANPDVMSKLTRKFAIDAGVLQNLIGLCKECDTNNSFWIKEITAITALQAAFPNYEGTAKENYGIDWVAGRHTQNAITWLLWEMFKEFEKWDIDILKPKYEDVYIGNSLDLRNEKVRIRTAANGIQELDVVWDDKTTQVHDIPENIESIVDHNARVSIYDWKAFYFNQSKWRYEMHDIIDEEKDIKTNFDDGKMLWQRQRNLSADEKPQFKWIVEVIKPDGDGTISMWWLKNKFTYFDATRFNKDEIPLSAQEVKTEIINAGDIKVINWVRYKLTPDTSKAEMNAEVLPPLKYTTTVDPLVADIVSLYMDSDDFVEPMAYIGRKGIDGRKTKYLKQDWTEFTNSNGESAIILEDNDWKLITRNNEKIKIVVDNVVHEATINVSWDDKNAKIDIKIDKTTITQAKEWKEILTSEIYLKHVVSKWGDLQIISNKDPITVDIQKRYKDMIMWVDATNKDDDMAIQSLTVADWIPSNFDTVDLVQEQWLADNINNCINLIDNQQEKAALIRLMTDKNANLKYLEVKNGSVVTLACENTNSDLARTIKALPNLKKLWVNNGEIDLNNPDFAQLEEIIILKDQKVWPHQIKKTPGNTYKLSDAKHDKFSTFLYKDGLIIAEKDNQKNQDPNVISNNPDILKKQEVVLKKVSSSGWDLLLKDFTQKFDINKDSFAEIDWKDYAINSIKTDADWKINYVASVDLVQNNFKWNINNMINLVTDQSQKAALIMLMADKEANLKFIEIENWQVKTLMCDDLKTNADRVLKALPTLTKLGLNKGEVDLSQHTQVKTLMFLQKQDNYNKWYANEIPITDSIRTKKLINWQLEK